MRVAISVLALVVVAGAVVATILGPSDATVGVLGGVLVVLIRELFDLYRRRSEDRRWYSSTFLQYKCEAVQRLYAAHIAWYRALVAHDAAPPETFDQYEEKLRPKEEAFIDAFAMAAPYLDESADKAVAEALGAFRQSTQAILHRLPDDEFPWDRSTVPSEVRYFPWEQFHDASKRAGDILREMLNPKMLQELHRAES